MMLPGPLGPSLSPPTPHPHPTPAPRVLEPEAETSSYLHHQGRLKCLEQYLTPRKCAENVSYDPKASSPHLPPPWITPPTLL